MRKTFVMPIKITENVSVGKSHEKKKKSIIGATI